MKLVLLAIILGNFNVTAYRSVPEQTDDSPNYTSTGEHVCGHGVAVSPDMFRKHGGVLDYGDTIYIEGIGFKVVNDTTNSRLKKHFDIWVPLYKDEKEHDKKYRGKKLKIWVIRHSLEKEQAEEPTTQRFKAEIWKFK